MQNHELRNLLSVFITNFQRVDVLWQLAALALCLALAWLLTRLLRRKHLPVGGAWEAGRRGLNRVLFPLIALLLLMVAREVVRQRYQVNLLNIAVPLLISWAVIRMVVFALRHAFAPSGWLAAFERIIALVVWAVVALHIVGLLPEIIDGLEAITFSVGKQKLSVWLLLQGAFVVLTTLLVALWIGGVLDDRLMRAEGMDASLRVVLARLGKAVLMLVAILISLPMVGIDLTTLSVFGGALGVGLGFGLQKIASNYVSGFIILLDRSIRMGNMITVDRYSGQVMQITTRYTVLRALSGVEAIVPNEVLVSSVVQNETYTNPQVRQSVQVQVSYAADPERAMAILVEVARRHPRVLADPEPKAFLVRFADSGVDLELGFWIGDPQEGTLGVRSDLNLEIWRAFKAAGIEIPFPQRDVRIIRARARQESET
ncbi:MAG: mechanosensitive ion channel domain-containing protein [Pseudomonadota bacterium]